MNQLSIKIRELRASDTRPFEELMYEAVYNPDPSNPYPREIIHEPRVAIYWKNWGFGEMDRCLVATIGGKIAGAVWCRLLNGDPKGFGYVDDKSPELTIALYPEYRGQGIGTMLFRNLVQQVSDEGFKSLCMSVSIGNPAINLYLREGFSIIEENEYDFILYKSLQS